MIHSDNMSVSPISPPEPAMEMMELAFRLFYASYPPRPPFVDEEKFKAWLHDIFIDSCRKEIANMYDSEVGNDENYYPIWSRPSRISWRLRCTDNTIRTYRLTRHPRIDDIRLFAPITAADYGIHDYVELPSEPEYVVDLTHRVVEARDYVHTCDELMYAGEIVMLKFKHDRMIPAEIVSVASKNELFTYHFKTI